MSNNGTVNNALKAYNSQAEKYYLQFCKHLVMVLQAYANKNGKTIKKIAKL